jgi:hypothetical protein
MQKKTVLCWREEDLSVITIYLVLKVPHSSVLHCESTGMCRRESVYDRLITLLLHCTSSKDINLVKHIRLCIASLICWSICACYRCANFDRIAHFYIRCLKFSDTKHTTCKHIYLLVCAVKGNFVLPFIHKRNQRVRTKLQYRKESEDLS